MVLRWTAAAVLEAVKRFRRLKGHKDVPTLVAALRERDQQLGITLSASNVAQNVTTPEDHANLDELCALRNGAAR
jgi:hypothetical protein